MLYDHILRFNGEWRSYQQRVLNRYQEYKSDGKIHIVAALGSGKTTLSLTSTKNYTSIRKKKQILRKTLINSMLFSFFINLFML